LAVVEAEAFCTSAAPTAVGGAIDLLIVGCARADALAGTCSSGVAAVTADLIAGVGSSAVPPTLNALDLKPAPNRIAESAGAE
jgi:hypothetical protein